MPQKFRKSRKNKSHNRKNHSQNVCIFIVENPNTWQPSSFYDASTNLIWVNSYELFVKAYTQNTPIIDTLNQTNKYAIHKDVYHAFSFIYNSKKWKNIKQMKKRYTRKLGNYKT